MMKKLLLLCLPFATTVALAQKDENAAKYAALITPKALKEKLTILAGPEMEGRETGTPGQKRAAEWIESEFKRMGLQPGNGSSYQQVYPLYADMITDKKLSVNGRQFSFDKDYSFTTAVPSGKWNVNNVVFAGYGLVDSAKGIDDYKGLDVRGKIVVVVDGGTTPAAGGPGGGRGGNFGNPKAAAAMARGAAGLLTVASNFPRTVPTPLKGRVSMTKSNATFFTASISDEVASALLGRTFRIPFADLKDINKGTYVSELAIVATKTVENTESSNVLGIIPGTDKKDEFVFLTGHYDHLGKNAKGEIFYGADDDGSGSVGVMQMAEAFAVAAKKGSKPRRTMIFMTVSGEEKGLWGSQYYSENPTVDLSKASVDLNTDMIGRGDTSRKGDTLNYIYVIGHDKLSSELAPINESVNKLYDINLGLDYKYDDPNDRNRIYFRSDHYNFARKGVPILFFYDGMLGSDYHKLTDTVDKIHFEVMAKRAQLVFHTGWVMANRDAMMKRDTPLNMGSR
ncbi:MAG: M28 family peptidase [Sediminibacterium sp.]